MLDPSYNYEIDKMTFQKPQKSDKLSSQKPENESSKKPESDKLSSQKPVTVKIEDWYFNVEEI